METDITRTPVEPLGGGAVSLRRLVPMSLRPARLARPSTVALLAVAALALPLLAGCTTLTPAASCVGAAGSNAGSCPTVVVRMVSGTVNGTDLPGHGVLFNFTADGVPSDLPAALAKAAHGLHAHESFTADVPVARFTRTQPSIPLADTATAAELRNLLPNPAPGARFTAGHTDYVVDSLTQTAAGNATVTVVHFHAEPDVSTVRDDFLASAGVYTQYQANATHYALHLIADPGRHLSLGLSNPLGFAAGGYRVLGANETEVFYAGAHGSGNKDDAVAHVTFEIVRVEPATSAFPTDGIYAGNREAPAAASTAVPTMAAAPASSSTATEHAH